MDNSNLISLVFDLLHKIKKNDLTLIIFPVERLLVMKIGT